MNNQPNQNSTHTSFAEIQDRIDGIVSKFLEANPDFITFAQKKDAALKGADKTPEVVRGLLATYPGVIAIAVHDVAHGLHKGGQIVEARELSEAAKSRTGIDIHPGATIGKNCFIDHGTGVVIGETAIVGDNVQIYHGVTLGAYGDPEESNPEKLAHRHPQIGNNCTISAGAEILGNVKIGDNVVIGSSSVLHGQKLLVGDGVMMGSSVRVGDKNIIAKDITIGTGTVIPKCIGEIKYSVPANSHMIKGDDEVVEPLTFKEVSVQLGIVKKITEFLRNLGFKPDTEVARSSVTR